MSAISRTKSAPAPKSSTNPYAGRGLDKFALVTGELQAKREKLAAKLGTPLSVVKFAIGSHSTWIPIIISPSDNNTRPSLDLLHSDQTSLAHSHGSSAATTVKDDTTQKHDNHGQRISTTSVTPNIALPDPIALPSKGKFKIYLQTAIAKLAAKTLGSKNRAKKTGAAITVVESETPTKKHRRPRVPCERKSTTDSASDSAVNPSSVRPSADLTSATSAADHDKMPKKHTARDTSNSSAAAPSSSTGAMETTVKHHKSFPIKSLARIYSGPKSPKNPKKESSSDAMAAVKSPDAADAYAGARERRHSVEADNCSRQNQIRDRSHQQQPNRLSSGSAMAMQHTSRLKYELVEKSLSRFGFLLALIGLFGSYMWAIALLVCWWYMMPIFRNIIGYKPVVMVDACNQRQMPKYVSIHSYKKHEFHRRP